MKVLLLIFFIFFYPALAVSIKFFKSSSRAFFICLLGILSVFNSFLELF
ncbi:hypothetical protein BBU64B_J0001 (plasmid) [Borreliella burgdorferi 64b]|nr:hypothetical protein BBU64B_J0001 [Borreliella burgdorferi 64b]